MMRAIEHAIHAEERALAELDRARARLQSLTVEHRIEIVGRIRGQRPARDLRAAIVRFTIAGKAYFEAVARTTRYLTAAHRARRTNSPRRAIQGIG